MGRIAKAIKIAHCRHRYHLTGAPGVPSADGEAAAPAGMRKFLLHAAFPNAGTGIAGSIDVSGY